ncbi:MAG: hypothetical protein M0036_22205, partial [Desulfobacteraceae bacterium]|nr:hypothetical protein [Desulfobacteraceae bacterium]
MCTSVSSLRAETLPAPITAIQVQIEEEQSLGFDWEGLARAVIRMQPGETITSEQLKKNESNLGLFSEVKTTVTPQGQGVELTFRLRPFKRIYSIDIDGAYPLFEKDVLNAMTVAAGEIFRPDQMPEQESHIAQLYRTEGYVDPKVKITWTADGPGGHYRLRVVIDKGAYYVLGKMELQGNHAMTQDDLLTRMAVYRKSILSPGGGRFQPQDLKEDIRNLVAYYRSYGFAEVAITPVETFDARRARVDCRLEIEEGPRYSVSFEGNHYFFDIWLQQDLVIFKSGNVGNIGLRRSAQNIRRRYLQSGFADVKVHWEEKRKTENGVELLHVTMMIEEGARHIVESVVFQGNAHMDTKTITAQMLTRPPTWLSSGA